MIRSMVRVLASVWPVVLPGLVAAQAKHYPLESVEGLRPHNVIAQPATHKGKKGLRLAVDTARLRDRPAGGQAEVELLASIGGVEFSNGVIEAEVTGRAAPGAFEGARGFVGIAFRVQEDNKTYDAFYLRPTNGRAEDQERRNHATQYISHPDWPWFRLRRETPSRYEAYVDLVPDEWTKIRIEVRGARARLYVHDQQHPTLIVNDVKSGANGKGGVALWIGPGTVAHFRNLTVKPDPETR
ncbi:MAG: family 16 glycoside hydrolase [Gemmatimonadaceae bacterium]